MSHKFQHFWPPPLKFEVLICKLFMYLFNIKNNLLFSLLCLSCLGFSVITCVAWLPYSPFSSPVFFSVGYIKLKTLRWTTVWLFVSWNLSQFLQKIQTLFFHVSFSFNYYFQIHWLASAKMEYNLNFTLDVASFQYRKFFLCLLLNLFNICLCSFITGLFV